MGSTAEQGAKKQKIHADWLARLEGAHVLMGAREGIAAELGRWLDPLLAAGAGDQSAAHELYKLVAFHARGLGGEGRPASAALMQVLLLQDAVGPAEPPLAEVLRELLRIVVDAHALGASERSRNRHHLEIRDFSPVVRLGEHTVIGFLLGAMDSDLIDAMIGRLLRETARSGARHVVLDAFGAARDNDTFHRTIQAFLRSEVGSGVHFTLCGLRDTESTREALEQVGCRMDRLHFEPDINTAIDHALAAPPK